MNEKGNYVKMMADTIKQFGFSKKRLRESGKKY